MSTIIKTNKKNTDHNSFLLQVRYGAPDAKVALQTYIAKNPLLAKTPMTKKLVKEIFFENTLSHFTRKSVEPLCEFLFQQAQKRDYIVVVPKIWSTDEQEYIVLPTISEKRPGPRRKE